MKTLILPGYSAKNKAWAEEVGTKFDSQIIYWKHWSAGTTTANWTDEVAREIVSNLGSQINILAHSVGTIVAMKILKLKPEFINKIILCGIPIHDFQPGDQELYQALKPLDIKNILCVQNENDNHGSFFEMKTIINAVNPNIQTLSMPASDHTYPYFKEFSKFLTGVIPMA